MLFQYPVFLTIIYDGRRWIEFWLWHLLKVMPPSRQPVSCVWFHPSGAFVIIIMSTQHIFGDDLVGLRRSLSFLLLNINCTENWVKSSSLRLEIRNLNKPHFLLKHKLNWTKQKSKITREEISTTQIPKLTYLHFNVNNAYQIASAQNGPKATRSNLCKCQHFPAIWIILPFVNAEEYPRNRSFVRSDHHRCFGGKTYKYK